MEDLVRKRPFFLRNLSCTLSRHTVGDASHRILYTVANSNAMNGMGFNTIVEEVHGWWQDAITYGQIGTGVLAALFLVIAILDSRKAKKQAA